MMPDFGPTFGTELIAAGLVDVKMAWTSDGQITFADDVSTQDRDAVQVVVDAHDSTRPDPVEAHTERVRIGCQVVSPTNSNLNGTYAIDDASRANLVSEMLYIQVTSLRNDPKFTNGQPTKAWPDINRQLHTFTTDEFGVFAERVAEYYDALMTWVGGGALGDPPAQPVNIDRAAP